MKPYYQDNRATIYCGDCIEVMAEMPENSVDAIVTDPPYGIRFMGKAWDGQEIEAKAKDRELRGPSLSRLATGRKTSGFTQSDYAGAYDFSVKGNSAFQDWSQQWATQALRVLKPGGYLLAFGGTRTEHRLKCGIEDAGFEIRDTICWLFGSGFPKNLDISKQYEMELCERVEVKPKQFEWHYKDTSEKMRKETPYRHPMANEWAGWGTALKPAFEPICVARKPLSEKTVAENVLKWGTGGLDIDGARIGTEMITVRGDGNVWVQAGREGKPSTHFQRQGRWPANVILECTCEEVLEGDEIKSGNFPSFGGDFGKHGRYGKARGIQQDARQLTDKIVIHTDPNCPCRMLDEQSGLLKSGKDCVRTKEGYFGEHGGLGRPGDIQTTYGDSGGASRFFYCAKSSRAERSGGLDSTRTCKYNVPRGKLGGILCKDVAMVLVALLQKATSELAVTWRIGESGASITGLCPTDSLSTILTAISEITESKILHLLTSSLIRDCILAANSEMASGGSHAENVVNSNQSKQTIINASQVELGQSVKRVVSELLLTINDVANWKPISVNHPTVKPISLMEYLIKLVSRRDSIILDPFGGSMSTVLAAVALGRECIAIEQSEEYCEMLKGRCRQMVMELGVIGG